MTITQNPKIAQAVQITNLMNSGTPILANPLLNAGNEYGASAAALRAQVSGTYRGMAPSHPAYYLLQKVDAGLGTSIAQSTALVNHGNLLIFGDPRSSSIISGGLQANLGIAMSAMNLDNTLNGAGAASGGGNPCALVAELFSTVLGKGQELLNNMIDALKNSALGQFIQKVGDLVNEAEEAIAAAIEEAKAAIEQALGDLQYAVDQIASHIAESLAQFGEWISKLLNFNLANFLAGLFDDPCFRLVVGVVGTAALVNSLATSPARTSPRVRRPGIWSVPGGGGWNMR